MAKNPNRTRFEELDLEQVRMLVQWGRTHQEIADFLGIHLSTWEDWRAQHPEVAEACVQWRREADERVERSLWERAVGYSTTGTKVVMVKGRPVLVPVVKNYPPSVTAAIFWLRNRLPDRWKDIWRIQHSADPSQMPMTLDASKLSDEVLLEIMEAKRAAEALPVEQPRSPIPGDKLRKAIAAPPVHTEMFEDDVVQPPAQVRAKGNGKPNGKTPKKKAKKKNGKGS